MQHAPVRRLRRLVPAPGPLMALALGCLASVTHAQEPTIAEQRVRVAQLRQRLAQLESDGARRDRGARATLRLDTLRVGGFTIVTDSGGSTRLRAAAESAWVVVRQDLDATAETFRPYLVFVRMSRSGPNWGGRVRRGDQSFDGNASLEGLRSRFLAAAGSIAADRAGSRVGLWAGAALSLHHDRRDLRWRALVEMVTATTPSGRGCNAGDMGACAVALGIGPAGDAALGTSGPFSKENASGVLRAAARLGGTGAFDRLVADTAAPLTRRLEAMAGVPVDSVLRAWWNDARGSPRPPVTVPPRTQWVTVAWTLAFAALALRSTRWR